MLPSVAVRTVFGPFFAFALALAGAWTPAAEGFVWPSAPARIAHVLRAGDASERIAAAKQIAELEGAVAEPLLRAALVDLEPDVRIAAAQAAAQVRSRASAQTVVAWLTDPDARVRLAACEVLRAAPVASAFGALARVLSDPDPTVRMAGASALATSGATEATGALLGHIDDPAPQVRLAVADALAQIGDVAAAIPLLGKVSDPAPEVRRSVARALGELGEPRAASALVLAVRDQVAQVRIEAVTALGRLRAAEAVLSIAPLLEERESSDVRAAALAALGHIGTQGAIRLLIKALATDDVHSDASTVRTALRRSGPNAKPALLDALRSYVPGIAAGAALTLGPMGVTGEGTHTPSGSGGGEGPAIVEAIRRGNVPPEPGLRALALLGDPNTVPVVLEFLGHSSPTIRRQAMLALEVLLEPSRHDGRAVEPLAAMLRRAQLTLEERESLVRALGRTGAPRALATLVPLCGPRQRLSLRLAALDALGAIGPAGQDATLLDALQDADAAVRTRAAFALSLTAASTTVSTLLSRLVEAPAQDRIAVGVALSGALSRSVEARVVERIRGLVSTVGDRERDALIEGLGRMRGAESGAALAQIAAGARDAADRCKAAEALANRADRGLALRALLDDPDANVRAQAAWSWAAGGASREGPRADEANRRSPADLRDSLDRVLPLMKAPEPDVATNATASVYALGLELAVAGEGPAGQRAAEALCRAMRDSHAYVRVNALVGLAGLHQRCTDGRFERDVLANDPVDLARMAAARLLASVPLSAADSRALLRCVGTDRSGSVARVCRDPLPAAKPSGASPLIIFVVPDGSTKPEPRAPFALLRSDGLVRAGVADRRGALFEEREPKGTVRLIVPGALVW